MNKVFEDYFSELQADMVSICLEYVEERAEKIYIYCYCENRAFTGNFFYKINGKIVHSHQLNDVIADGEKEYDTSIDVQKQVLHIIVDDIMALYKLCQEYQREMPTEIKLTYDVKENKLKADYNYETVYSDEDDGRAMMDVFFEWYDLEKSREEI